MKFKVGDKVKFLNDTGGGTVSEIIDNKVVNVRIEDGFDVPVLASELIGDINEDQLIEKQDEYSGRTENAPVADTGQREVKDSDISSKNLPEETLKNIYFGIVSEDESVIYNSDLNTYIVNDSDFYIFYVIGYQEKDSFFYLKSGILEANTKEYVKTFTQRENSKIKKFHFQILFLSKGRYFPQHPVNENIGISSISLYKESNYKENEFFEKKAVIFKIDCDNFENELERITDDEIVHVKTYKDKKDISKAEKPANKQKSEIEEVDLHIGEISDDYSGLSDGEKLNLQLNRFYSVIDKAISEKRRKKIVFIHGVGNGKLKYEIRKALDDKYSDLEYQDASFKAYGFGATLVTVR